jgi:hypothetical protein
MSPADSPVCVQCRSKPMAPAWRPFCSDRCRLLDLARWVDGGYRVAAEPVTSDADDGEPASTES